MVFTMNPSKEGRVKYLLLTLGPSFLISRISVWLTGLGLLPETDLTGMLVMLCSMAITFTLGYFFILKKNHIIEVSDLSLAEKNWQGACRVIPRGKIRSFRKNWLGELVLLDGDGKPILCVESNMENRNRLNEYLDRHQIYEYNKEN